jgi:rhamnulokinase
MKPYLAIDIGASSGRHIVGYMKDGELFTEEIYRFPNGMDTLDGHLVWDTDRLLREVKEGIRLTLLKYPETVSLSIDTWGVDYVLMKGDEEVKPTYAYRDARVEEPIKEVHSIIPFEELYKRTGTQFNKFNTIYQLYADKKADRLGGVTDFLMIPEYLMYKLTGVKKKEFTEASTTGLVNAGTLEFDEEIFHTLGLPKTLIKKVDQPGDAVGSLSPEVAKEVGGNLLVVVCATHDT